jgi:hypothetical protein
MCCTMLHAAVSMQCSSSSSTDLTQQQPDWHCQKALSAFCLDLSHVFGSVVTRLGLLCKSLAVAWCGSE